MICPKCGSENVTVQAVGNVKKKGVVPLWYWICFVWLIDWLFLFRIARRAKNKVKTKMQSQAVCQNCGNMWKTQ